MVTTTRPKTHRNKAKQSNVTETRTALRKSEARFRTLIENTSDLLWEVDEVCVYTYVSPNVAAVMGYEGDEVVGKTLLDFMPANEAKRFGKALARLLSEQEPFSGLERTIRCKNGRLMTTECSGTPVLDSKRQFKGFRGVDRDISEKKRLQHKDKALAETRSREQAELVEQSKKLVSQLLPWGW